MSEHVQDSNASMGNFDPVSGNVTGVPTYPNSQYTYTTTLGGWGQSNTAAGWTGTAVGTSDYLFGGSQMYHVSLMTTPPLYPFASFHACFHASVQNN